MFYRYLLAGLFAMMITSSVFAADVSPQNTTDTSATAQKTDTSTAAAENKVNLNQASAKELMKVKGINASKARAIVRYRKKHGDFKSVEDLSKVRGFSRMKATKLKKIQDQLTL